MHRFEVGAPGKATVELIVDGRRHSVLPPDRVAILGLAQPLSIQLKGPRL